MSPGSAAAPGARLVLFDVAHLYYLPQFLPICRELRRRGGEAELVIYADQPDAEAARAAAVASGVRFTECASLDDALRHYREREPDWIVFGNSYRDLAKLPGGTRTAMVNHGAGIKSAGYAPEMNAMDVRFVEGRHHFDVLREMYPQRHFVHAGFAKLDPLINGEQPALPLAELGLDPGRPTVLYAPTFYPSSMDRMADSLPGDLAGCNLLVKLHHFSLTKSRYRSHVDKTARWARSPNVYVAGAGDYSLAPFLQSADLLISDASTTLFEAAALDKPVVWCDFITFRWTYRGILSFRRRARMDQRMDRFADIARHAGRYAELAGAVREQLEHPEMFRARRAQYAELLLGPCDGKASQRIVSYLIGESSAAHDRG